MTEAEQSKNVHAVMEKSRTKLFESTKSKKCLAITKILSCSPVTVFYYYCSKTRDFDKKIS